MEHPDFVTVCKGMGFFASHWSYCEEDGFYQPWQTLSSHYGTADEAEVAAKMYAEQMGLEYRPWTAPYRTLAEADRYSAIYREEGEKRRDVVREIRNTLGYSGRKFFEALEALGEGIGVTGDRARARFVEERGAMLQDHAEDLMGW